VHPACRCAIDTPMHLPRLLTAQFLQQIIAEGRSFDALRLEDTRLGGLAPRDRAWVQRVLLTALRRHGELDALLAARLSAQNFKGRASLFPWCLRVALTEALWLAHPTHAVVAEWRKILHAQRMPGLGGLLHGVISKAMADPPPPQPQRNLPVWLATRWQTQYGTETATAMAAMLLTEAPLDLSLRDATPDPALLPEGMLLPTGGLRCESSAPIHTLPGYAEGAWWVQDASATLPVQMLGDVRGKRVLDLCAAPGGKTMQLAARGAEVCAVDRSAARMERLHENLHRTGLASQVEVVVGDALHFAATHPFDAVLLDAPCSATGILRRHPDYLWGKTDSLIDEMAALQQELIRAAVAHLRPGGVLVYAVCSLEREEGEAQMEWIALEGLPLEPFPIAHCLPADCAEWISNDNSLRILPHYWQEQGGMDGFFAAAFIKTP
jgi:16S rRNA (cytosine967-C5)-methyltransferase